MGAPPVAFTEETIAHALENIYRRRFNRKTQIEPGLFAETVRLLNLATATGISQAMDNGAPEPDDDFLHALKTNNEVFAAFRTHRMQNDIAAQMTDNGGNLKSFSQFARDVRPYTDHKNRQWLRTEYNTAVIRAHQAADWQQFQAERDVLPNLEWMPSVSPTPGQDHQPFWGTILPIDHPFWKQHRPGDRWNCKCSLSNTDQQPTAVPATTDGNDPHRGLENNPGTDGKIFGDKHPYFPDSCAACPFGHGKLWALAAGKKKNCANCQKLEKAKPVSMESLQKRYGKKWKVDFLDEKSGGYIVEEEGHGQSERNQNIASATPLAQKGRQVELLRQNTVTVNGQKKKVKSYDAHVDGEKWEFKYTAQYEKLDKSIGTKAGQAVEQGANVLLIDIHKTERFTVECLINGIDNAFKYNESLKNICVMIESKDFIEISRGYWNTKRYINQIKKWLE